MQTSLAKKLFAVGSSAAMLVSALPFVASAAVHSAGTNVLSNGTVYFINAAGQKQPYTSAGAFLSYGTNSWSNVVAASAEDLALPTGPFVPPADGSIINDGGTVYLITNGQRAGFTTPSAFLGFGYSWSNVINGDTSFMTALTPISSAAMAHPAGTLVNQDGTIYLMSATGKMGIPSPAVFNSWGYSWSRVVLANSYDRAVPMSNGVMPSMAAGYLNPLAQVAAGGTVNPSPTPTPTGSGALSVALDPSTPASGSVAKGAKAVLSRFDLTAGSSGATINSLVVHRIGLSSDSDVSNVYLYNTASGTQLAVGSFNQGVVTFTGSPLLTVPANTTVVVGIRADMNTSGTTGDSIGYGMASANDLPGISATGNFPVNGNLQTIAGVSNLGALTITSPSNVSATMNPGTLGANIGYFQLAGSNQPLSLTYLKLTNVGSVGQNDIQNIKLFNGSTQVGQTMQQAADKTVTFDLSSSPMVIPSGTTVNLYVRGDVVSGSNRNFQFTIQRTSDVNVVDNTYNTGIVVGLGTLTGTSPVPSSTTNQVSVNAGSATLQVDQASPTGNIATGANGVTLGTFDFTSAGEDVRISQITVTTIPTNQTGGSSSDFLKNGKLVDITGGGSVQIGSTSNLNFDTSAGNANKTTVFSIPGYWTVPAGTTRTLAVVSDTIANTATAAQLSNSGTGTITVQLTGSSSGIVAQGVNSLSTVTFGNSNGRTLTFTAGALTASANSALLAGSASNITAVPGQTNIKIASFQLVAGSAEGVNVSQIQLTTGAVAATDYQNMKVMVGSTQVGTTQPTLANSTVYSFSPATQLNIPAGSSIVVDVYADVLTGATTGSTQATVNLTGLTATGSIDNQSITATGTPVTGQVTYMATGGTLTVSADPQDPTAAQLQQLPMGAGQQTLGVFNLAANNVENINVTKVVVTDTETATNVGIGDFQNMKLYVNGTAVCNGLSVPSLSAASSTTATATFNLQSCPIVVPKNQNVSVYFKADVSPFPNGTSGAAHSFGLASSAVTSQGAVSGASGGASASVAGIAATVYKTTLTIAKDASSPSGLSSPSATQTVAVLDATNATNQANAQVTLWPKVASGNSISFTFNSSIAIVASVSRIFAVYKASDLTNPVLKVTIATGTSPSGNWNGTLTINNLNGGATATFTPTGSGSIGTGATVTANTVLAQTLNSGQTQQYVVQFDTTDVVSTNHPSFTLSIQTQGSNQVWSDGVTNVSTLMGAPLTFNSLNY